MDAQQQVAAGLRTLYVELYRRYRLSPREFAVIVAQVLSYAIPEAERRAELAKGGDARETCMVLDAGRPGLPLRDGKESERDGDSEIVDRIRDDGERRVDTR